MGEVTVNVFTAIVIAVISAWITVQLSLRRFRTEWWWQHKADAYSQVIDALHNSKVFADQHLEAEYRGRELTEERKKELRARARAAQDDIQRAMNVGAFVLAEEALNRLKLYREDAEAAAQYDTWFEYLDADLDAVDRCLKDIIDIAKKDLRR